MFTVYHCIIKHRLFLYIHRSENKELLKKNINSMFFTIFFLISLLVKEAIKIKSFSLLPVFFSFFSFFFSQHLKIDGIEEREEKKEAFIKWSKKEKLQKPIFHR
jgi:hypothetical protein